MSQQTLVKDQTKTEEVHDYFNGILSKLREMKNELK